MLLLRAEAESRGGREGPAARELGVGEVKRGSESGEELLLGTEALAWSDSRGNEVNRIIQVEKILRHLSVKEWRPSVNRR